MLFRIKCWSLTEKGDVPEYSGPQEILFVFVSLKFDRGKFLIGCHLIICVDTGGN